MQNFEVKSLKSTRKFIKECSEGIKFTMIIFDSNRVEARYRVARHDTNELTSGLLVFVRVMFLTSYTLHRPSARLVSRTMIWMRIRHVWRDEYSRIQRAVFYSPRKSPLLWRVCSLKDHKRRFLAKFHKLGKTFLSRHIMCSTIIYK